MGFNLALLRRRRFVGAVSPLAIYAVLGFTPLLVFDFDSELYATGGVVSTFDDSITHSATTNATMVDSDGVLKWRPHNLALNSASPATQSITVVSGADYTVECTGVSIALSGAGSGTVTEGNPVEITASTTTLTLTVTGSTGTMWVYRSDLGGMVDNPDTGNSYVPTTSAARYLPRRGHHVWNGSAWVNEGLLHEIEQRTNLALHSRDLSDAAWTKTDVTAAKTATAVTGETNGATTLTATAGNGTVTQAITSASALRVTSMWVKRRTGTGDIEMTQDNGSTWTAVTVTSGWTRVNLDAVTSTDPTVGIRIVTSGDEIDVDFFQHEVGGQPSSEIPTSGATVTRAAETLTIPAAKLPWPTPNVIGPELVTNGTFDTDSDWTKGTGWTISGGQASHVAGSATLLYQLISLTLGKVYKATCDVVSVSGGTGSLQFRSGGTTTVVTLDASQAGTTVELLYVAEGNTQIAVFAGSGTNMTIDNISVREIDPLSVSIQMDGLETFSDEGSATQETLFDWRVDANNRITLALDTDSTKVGTLTLTMVNGSGTDETISTTAELTPGVNDPFNVAIVCTSNEIGIALDGTAETRVSHSIGLPDLSGADATLGGNGARALVRAWNQDITNAGQEAATV